MTPQDFFRFLNGQLERDLGRKRQRGVFGIGPFTASIRSTTGQITASVEVDGVEYGVHFYHGSNRQDESWFNPYFEWIKEPTDEVIMKLRLYA